MLMQMNDEEPDQETIKSDEEYDDGEEETSSEEKKIIPIIFQCLCTRTNVSNVSYFIVLYPYRIFIVLHYVVHSCHL